MLPKKLRQEVGATCRIAKRLLYSKRKISKYSNLINLIEIDRLLLTERGEYKLSGKQKPVCFFHYPNLEGIVFYCHEKYTKVMIEGPVESFFIEPLAVSCVIRYSLASGVNASSSPTGDTSTITTSNLLNLTNNRGSLIPSDIFHSTNVVEDIVAVRNFDFIVDDDSDPAPENVPERLTSTTPHGSVSNGPNLNTPKLYDSSQEWNDTCVNRRRVSGASDIKSSLLGLVGKDPKTCTFLEIFLIFLSDTLVRNIILPATNVNLPPYITKISYGEFLR